jgi:glycosyltransferase involved in cell wall biosynthesis
MPELSIIVPCYNEEGNLPMIIKGFDELVRRYKEVEVLLVDNGSTDQSAIVLKEQLAKLPHQQIRLVTVPVNKGYGYGILEGLQQANGNILAWTHADGQTDPADVITAWEKYKILNDPMLIVKGKRKNRAMGAAFFTWAMQCITNLLLHTRLNDINAQPKLFSRIFYERVAANAPHDFSLDVYWLYHAYRQGRIEQVPVSFKKRLYGEAKGGGNLNTRIKLIRRTFSYLLRLRTQLREKETA